ncbi:translation initiation factor IF-2-like [Oxyura jamaicensis]|uniref:translation initiation factor IF-2-like n=1 Tax=Oxyura jamaicensis TaxID=8884 RepID=UPI0015A5AEBB|nr:translation initiation factor IF-2-like [Oxyura jamaicensis]
MQTAGGWQNSPRTLLVLAFPHFPARPYELTARKQPLRPPQPSGQPLPSLAPLAAPRPPGLAPRPGAAAAHTVELDARTSPVPCNDPRQAREAAAPVRRWSAPPGAQTPPPSDPIRITHSTSSRRSTFASVHRPVSEQSLWRQQTLATPQRQITRRRFLFMGNSVPCARGSAKPRAEEATHINLQHDFS